MDRSPTRRFTTFLLAWSMVVPALFAGLTLGAPLAGAHPDDGSLPAGGGGHGEAGGTGDAFWNVVDGFTTKTGYRAVWIWDVDAPIAAQVKWGYAPDALDFTAMPLGDFVETAGIAIMDVPRADVQAKKTVHYRIVDLATGTASPLGSFRLGNAYTSDASDGVYEVNALLQLDTQSLPDDPAVSGDAALGDLAAAVDIMAERIWDMSDGYVRLGKVVVTDTSLNYPLNVPFGTPVGFNGGIFEQFIPGGGLCAGSQDAGGYNVQNTVADFLVQTTVPADSHTYKWAIDHPCTPFYIGREGWLRIPDFPWRGDLDMASTMTHEFGHYAFGLEDLYTLATANGGNCFTGVSGVPDNAQGRYDISVMNNQFAWNGQRWVGSELDRVGTPCNRGPLGTDGASWPILRSRYTEIPALGRNGDDMPDHADSVYNQPRDNPDGGAVDLYILDHDVGLSRINHYLKAQEQTTGTPTLTITEPANGATVSPTTLTVAGGVDRFATGAGAPVPTMTASPAAGEAPLDVTFTLGATDPDGDALASWSLDFGDGGAPLTGTGGPAPSATHTYTANGDYDALLSVTDATGATGEALVSVHVGPSGRVRIGTDPAGDTVAANDCGTPAIPCERAWVAGARDGFDLRAAYVEDVGEAIRIGFEVVDGEKFFVDPSGDPASGASRIVSYSLTVSFQTSPGTQYTMDITRARGTSDLTVALGKFFGVDGTGLTFPSNLGGGVFVPEENLFYGDLPKSQFPEIAVLSTLQNLQASATFLQQGQSVALIQQMDDSLETVENPNYAVPTAQSPLGLVRAPELAMAPPASAPADAEIQDATGDSAGGLAHADIQAAWFANDADNVYVGMKIADIPADPTTTAGFFYEVRFKPEGVTAWPGVTGTFTGLRVIAALHGADTSNVAVGLDHTYELQVLYTTATGNSYTKIAGLPASTIDAGTDILWWVVPRVALNGLPDGAVLGTLSASTGGTFGGRLTLGGVDSATSTETYTLAGATGPLEADAGIAYSGVTGVPIAIVGDATGGVEPYTCAWSGPGATFANADACATTVTYAAAGAHTLTLTVTDDAGDTSVDMAQVSVSEAGAERVELYVDGVGPLATIPLDTSGATSSAPWSGAVDLTGHSGARTLSARWFDADGTLLDDASVDVFVETTVLPPYVRITQPGDGSSVTTDTFFAAGRAGHGDGAPQSQQRVNAFAPGGIFSTQSSATVEGLIAAFCALCEGPAQGPGLAASAAYNGGPGEITDGTDGVWLDVAGFGGANYLLESEFGSPSDIAFFTAGLQEPSETLGTHQGGDMPKTGTVPSGANWAFVYVRIPTGGNPDQGWLETVALTLTPPVPPLSAPRSLTAIGLAGAIQLAWQAPAEDGGSAITGYEVHRDGALHATIGNLLTYTDGGLGDGETHTYTVRALTALETGPFSDPATATTNAPDTLPPTQVTGVTLVDASAATAAISWSAASDNLGVAEYRVYVDDVLRATTAATSATIGGLVPETTYAVTVAARDAAGNEGAKSAPLSVTTDAAGAESVVLRFAGEVVATIPVDTTGGEDVWGSSVSTVGLPEGLHVLHATFTDAQGATATDAIGVFVVRATLGDPSVSITTPDEDGDHVATPFRVGGAYSTDGSDPAETQGARPADVVDDALRAFAGDAFVQQTLKDPGYTALVAQLRADVPGFLGAVPTPQGDIAVLLSGDAPQGAPSTGLDVPLRYLENQVPEIKREQALRPARGMTLEEFEIWKTEMQAQGPYAPTPQTGVGPGTAIQQDINGAGYICTASWLFEHPTTGKYYLGTAGHCLLDRSVRDHWTSTPTTRARVVSVCVDLCVANYVGLGIYVDIPRTSTFDPVAFAQQWNTAETDDIGTDFGLVEIPASVYEYLRPHMYFWGGATGEGELAIGDPLVLYGHGWDAGTAQAHQRAGVSLGDWNDGAYWNVIYTNGGDSGSAIASAAARSEKMLFGDKAVGTLTHGLGVPVPNGPALGVMMGTKLGRGLDMVEARLGWRPALVTEDADIRAPGASGPSLAADVLLPETGTTFANGASVDVVGTAAFPSAAGTPGTASVQYFLHRTSCGAEDVLYMDEARALQPEGGNGCGLTFSPVGGLLATAGVPLADAFPAQPAPAQEMFLDVTRPAHVQMFVAGRQGTPLPYGEYEFRLTTDAGSVVLAQKRVELTGPYNVIEADLDWTAAATSVPAGADLAFVAQYLNSAGQTYVYYGGETASNVVIPVGGAPARAVQVSVDDPTFAAESLLESAGSTSWVATWDVADAAPGAHTLYVRAVQGDDVQTTPTVLNVNVLGSDVPPAAAFQRLADGLSVAFADASTTGSAPIASHAWTFGDGGTSADASPTHVYAEAGAYDVTLTVTDADGRTDSATRRIDVAAPGGWQLQVRFNGGAWTPIDEASTGDAAAWSHVVTAAAPGAATVEARLLRDGITKASAQRALDVVRVNHPPVLAPVGALEADEGATLALALSASDADLDALVFTATGMPAGATLDASTGDFSWTPSYDAAGTHAVTFRVTDGEFEDAETVTIAVVDTNRAPVLAALATREVADGDLVTVVVSASDPDGDAFTLDAAGLPEGATFTPEEDGTGTFSWTPSQEQVGSHLVTFNATDARGETGATDLVVLVGDVDHAPVFGPMGNAATFEGVSLALEVRAADPDGAPVTLTASGLPAGATFTQAEPGVGAFSWTPAFNQAGSYAVTFTATDGTDTTTEQVLVEVAEGDGEPVIVPVDPQVLHEGETVRFFAHALDPEGDRLAYAVENMPRGATFNVAKRLFTWTPDFEQEGEHTVKIRVSDATHVVRRDVNLTVLHVNRAPVVAGGDAFSVIANRTLTFRLPAVDPDGDALTFAASGLPAGATLDAETGDVTWTPAADEVGAYTVAFTATDDAASASGAATLTALANAAPVVNLTVPARVEAGVPAELLVDGFDPDGGDVTFEWDFDAADGFEAASTETRLNHTFAALRSFTVTVRAQDSDGFVTYANATVVVDDRIVLELVVLESPGDGKTGTRAWARLTGWNGTGIADQTLRMVSFFRHPGTGAPHTMHEWTVRTGEDGSVEFVIPKDTPLGNLPGGHTLTGRASVADTHLGDTETAHAAVNYSIA